MIVDRIGLLFGPPDEAGEAEALPGWHVNLTAAGMAGRPDLAPWRVTPDRLLRVWAGDDPAAPVATVPLRFADAAEAAARLG